jgi:hypothetical protein
MSAGIFNTVLDQGSVFSLQLTCEDPSSTPINLTGLTAEMQLRSLPDDSNAVLTLSSANGDIVIQGAQGIITVTASSTETEFISPGPYYYDLELTDPVTSLVTRVVQGQIVVSAEVTR